MLPSLSSSLTQLSWTSGSAIPSMSIARKPRGYRRPSERVRPGRVLEVAFGGVVVGAVAAIFATSCGVEKDGELVTEVEQALVSPVTVSFQNGALPTSAYVSAMPHT